MESARCAHVQSRVAGRDSGPKSPMGDRRVGDPPRVPTATGSTAWREESMRSSAGSYRHRQHGEERGEEAIPRWFPRPQAARAAEWSGSAGQGLAAGAGYGAERRVGAEAGALIPKRARRGRSRQGRLSERSDAHRKAACSHSHAAVRHGTTSRSRRLAACVLPPCPCRTGSGRRRRWLVELGIPPRSASRTGLCRKRLRKNAKKIKKLSRQRWWRQNETMHRQAGNSGQRCEQRFSSRENDPEPSARGRAKKNYGGQVS